MSITLAASVISEHDHEAPNFVLIDVTPPGWSKLRNLSSTVKNVGQYGVSELSASADIADFQLRWVGGLTVANLASLIFAESEADVLIEQMQPLALGQEGEFDLLDLDINDISVVVDAESFSFRATGQNNHYESRWIRFSDISQVVPINSETSTSVVRVDHWERHSTSDAKPFQMELEDLRSTHGQASLTLGSSQNADAALVVVFEVNNLHGSTEALPCAHVSFDESQLAFSIFKQGPNILIRMETDEELTNTTLPDGTSAYMARNPTA